ncbi:hypothetical protein J4Q44_G00051470, partial [Coregonus suidteri]
MNITLPEHSLHRCLVVCGFRDIIGSAHSLPPTHLHCQLRHLDSPASTFKSLNKYSPSFNSPCPGLLLGSALENRDITCVGI